MRVLFIDTVHPILEERLTKKGCICIDGTAWSREKCLEKLDKVQGIVVRSRFPIDAEFLNAALNLKFIARSGAGLENIDLDTAEKNGVTCFNAPEGNRNAVGEHALGMLLSLFNHLCRGNSEVRQGIWKREENRGIELDGKTVGIIGYGNNGRAFAKKLYGFDVNVLAYDKYKSDYSDQFANAASMDQIFQRADILSFHIPQNEETLFMADEAFFQRFKKPIYVINLARGKIIQTKDLLKGLQEKSILGACLDVLEYEKASFEKTLTADENPDFKALINMDNVIFSPHVGGWTQESYFKLSDVLADKVLERFFESEI
ncbi:MAG: NAD(P)-dependent oxidoreductase [Bacteroidota bacterium]